MQLFTVLAGMAELRVGDVKALALASTAWAFATVGRSDVQLCVVLAILAECRICDFKAQGPANTARAFATVWSVGCAAVHSAGKGGRMGRGDVKA